MEESLRYGRTDIYWIIMICFASTNFFFLLNCIFNVNVSGRAWYCDNISAGQATPTISASLNHLFMARNSSSGPCISKLLQVCTFARNFYKATKQCWHLLALVNPASVGQQVLAIVFLTSVHSLLSLASIFSLPPSVDCVLLCTAISSRLFSSAFLCQLFSLSSLGPSFSRPFPVLQDISPSGPLCGFRAKTDKEILWLAPTQTEMNATYCVTVLF